MRMAIEVGGTFTDLIWIDQAGRVRTHKVPSTPQDPSRALISGLEEALAEDLGSMTQLIHGSTVATNAVIEHKGCRSALITTRGFRDVLALQRQLRPNVYALACIKPEPLIPLQRTREVGGRINAAGGEIEVLERAEIEAVARELIEAESPEAIAVCLLHAYRNPAHEQQVRETLARLSPSFR